MQTPDMQSPLTPAQRQRAKKQNQHLHSTLFREFVAIVVVGALLAVIMTDAVVGMSSGFAPTNEAIGMMAGVAKDDIR